MSISSTLVPIIGGAFIIVLGIVLFYFLYSLLRMVGFFNLFRRKIKIPDEVYSFVIQKINEEEQPFIRIAEHFSKFPKKQQDLYVQAYLEVMEEQKMKGGN